MAMDGESNGDVKNGREPWRNFSVRSRLLLTGGGGCCHSGKEKEVLKVFRTSP